VVFCAAAQEPVKVPFSCAVEDLAVADVSCSDEDPCPV
jgi:hypothetical protein